jgi:hypothetical protein
MLLLCTYLTMSWVQHVVDNGFIKCGLLDKSIYVPHTNPVGNTTHSHTVRKMKVSTNPCR